MTQDTTKSYLEALSALGLQEQPKLPFLVQPYIIESRVYKNEQLNLDGYTFKNCAFIQCGLHSSKGNFQIIDCHFNGCAATFDGNALRIVRFSALMLATWEQLIAPFRPTVEQDGGVTIT